MKRLETAIKVSFTTRETLHVGSGTVQYGYSPVLQVVKQQAKPFIPGSAIKGVVRANFKRLLPHFREANLFSRDEKAIFGDGDHQGKVFFSDALPGEQFALDTLPGIRINRRTRTVEKGALFAHEIVVPGSCFHSTVLCRGLDEKELKSLLISLKECENTGFGRKGKLVSVKLEVEDGSLQESIARLPSREGGS